MTNDNKTPGYYTPIDGRIYGPIAQPGLPLKLMQAITKDWRDQVKNNCPSYAVSPDLLLKERMVEGVDFLIESKQNRSDKEWSRMAVPIKPASLDNAGNAEGEISEDAHEKEIMMQAFSKVRQLFDSRQWIMDGRGSYRYDDDRYKEEVRYLFDEFDALFNDTWKNIKTKSFEYREKIIANYVKSQPRSFTSKDMEALLDFVSGYEFKISEGITNRLTLCDGDWYWENDTDGDQPLSAKEVVNIFLNRDDK